MNDLNQERSEMDLTNLHLLSASEAARLIRDGVISSEQFVEACLARIREVDAQVQAWTFLDPDHALAQARAADAWRSEGRATGPLHGVPVGIKDIFDTADMPTENGSVLFCRPDAFPRCHSSCDAARSRRSDHGENGHNRVCVFFPW